MGAIARDALITSGGVTSPIEGFEEAPYRLAGGSVIWLGANPRAMHPRMVVIDTLPAAGKTLHVLGYTIAAWTPPSTPATAGWRLAERAGALRAVLLTIEPIRGFGNALANRELPFPLGLSMARLRALEHALVDGDEHAIERASIALLGVGTGLTPSGDDLVGGLLFATRLIEGGDVTPLAERLVLAAQQRTHVISAALFADLAHGAGYGWLHDVAAVLVSDAPIAAAIEPARALTRVGHSSGWDMLTGFILGATRQLAATPSIIRFGNAEKVFSVL
ncbi:MAG: DUF2877 domain-containing protein [Burkholderiales bacterium]